MAATTTSTREFPPRLGQGAMLFERIDAEIAEAWRAHPRDVLDFLRTWIAIDRAEAVSRLPLFGQFVEGRPPGRARRYESENHRVLLQGSQGVPDQVEAEFKAAPSRPPTPPEPSRTEARLGSSRETRHRRPIAKPSRTGPGRPVGRDSPLRLISRMASSLSVGRPQDHPASIGRNGGPSVRKSPSRWRGVWDGAPPSGVEGIGPESFACFSTGHEPPTPVPGPNARGR